jgi:hypothetical protein
LGYGSDRYARQNERCYSAEMDEESRYSQEVLNTIIEEYSAEEK